MTTAGKGRGDGTARGVVALVRLDLHKVSGAELVWYLPSSWLSGHGGFSSLEMRKGSSSLEKRPTSSSSAGSTEAGNTSSSAAEGTSDETCCEGEVERGVLVPGGTRKARGGRGRGASAGNHGATDGSGASGFSPSLAEGTSRRGDPRFRAHARAKLLAAQEQHTTPDEVEHTTTTGLPAARGAVDFFKDEVVDEGAGRGPPAGSSDVERRGLSTAPGSVESSPEKFRRMRIIPSPEKRRTSEFFKEFFEKKIQRFQKNVRDRNSPIQVLRDRVLTS